MQKKRIELLAITLAVIASIFVLFAMNVGFSCNLFTGETGACLSVAFDKFLMKRVDKMEITCDGHVTIITDPAVVNMLIQETTVATHAQIGCPQDRRIDLYDGEKLVRSMMWSTCEDTVEVYQSDFLHWAWSVEGIEEEGHVYLSNELVQVLNVLIEG